MLEKKESSNPLAGIYGLGVIGFTAVFYSQDGFWLALGKSLIWPLNVALLIADKLK